MIQTSDRLGLLECPDLSVGCFHVACMVLYDLFEASVVECSEDVVVICDVDDGWFVVVVPFEFRGGWRGRMSHESNKTAHVH